MKPSAALLEQALADTSMVVPNSDPASVRRDIEAHTCEPYLVSATVVKPGFPDIPLGSQLSGYCMAKNNGYWLVYSPERQMFFCFWGPDEQNLGAHGVFGSPIYCWSA